MRLENLMTSEELKTAQVSQSYFSRVAGISRMRVSQLIKAGLLVVDAEGILLLQSLQRFWDYQQNKDCYPLWEYVERYCQEEE